MNRELDRGQVQDRLPDLVHGTLSATEREVVERAVAADPELARELETIRAAHYALNVGVRAANTDGIVAAIGQPMRARRGLGVARWRIAAAIATIVIGGSSLAIVKNVFRGDSADPLTIVGSESTLVASADPRGISFGYDLSSLGADELEALLAELEKSGGLPSTQPKTTVVVPPVEAAQ
jgi:anti-sigma-K factor RskA